MLVSEDAVCGLRTCRLFGFQVDNIKFASSDLHHVAPRLEQSLDLRLLAAKRKTGDPQPRACRAAGAARLCLERKCRDRKRACGYRIGQSSLGWYPPVGRELLHSRPKAEATAGADDLHSRQRLPLAVLTPRRLRSSAAALVDRAASRRAVTICPEPNPFSF